MASNQEALSVGPKKFTLIEPFEYRGRRFEEFTARPPKVKDLRQFLKNVDRDAILAMEHCLAQLMDEDDLIIAELGIKDFSIMKKWFEDFLKPMMNDSEN